jgi:hypothetical protein
MKGHYLAPSISKHFRSRRQTSQKQMDIADPLAFFEDQITAAERFGRKP